MEKLKLEHLSSYLPYQLKCNVQGGGNKKFDMVGINTGFVEYHEIGRTVTEECYIEDCFPILRPLSDLSDKTLKEFNFIKRPVYKDDYNFYSYGFMYYCFKNHFDIFGLIERGLAIDINTIK